MSGVNPGKKIRRKTGMTIISVAGEQKNFRLSALQNGKGESPLNHIDEKPLSNKKFIEMLKEHVDLAKSILMTDQYSGYRAMKDEIFHYSIDHEKQFVDGEIHTNTIESFRSLLKRAWYASITGMAGDTLTCTSANHASNITTALMKTCSPTP